MNDVSTLTFGRWLKRLRAQHDLTQEALAELAYCSVQTIRFFEGGKRRPSVEMAERLVEVLAVPVDQQGAFIRLARTPLTATEAIVPEITVAEIGATPDESILPVAKTNPSTSTVSPSTGEKSAPPRLPLPTTLLVGRQPEAEQLQNLFLQEGQRLVTLVGPGGIGKTRLALHMAHALEPYFAMGAIFVPLVSISTGVELPTAIAGAMNRTLHHESSGMAQLDALLADQSLLLVLDNFEHLLAADGDAVIALIDHIGQQLPGISMLITSRERLRLPGEHIFELGGLSIPQTSPHLDPVTSDAVLFFLQRARQVVPSFALTPTNRAAIIRLSNLLGGMPLGIELAAAWMRTLSPDEIAAEIERSLDFLALSDRGVPARHRSLRAAFEHSWRLLSADEQKVAARLSIFRGGFRREGAQEVAGANLPNLAALIDKSLVQVVTKSVGQEGGLRYEIHELIRQYLREKLAEMGDETAVATRHIEYFTHMAEKVNAHTYATIAPESLRHLQAEHGNLRAAMEWALLARNAPNLGLRLVGSLGRFWYFGDAWTEGIEWLRLAFAAIDETTPSEVRARVLMQLGDLEHTMSEYADAQKHLAEALSLWRRLDDQPRIAWTLFTIAIVYSTLAYFDEAEVLFDESLAIYRQLDEPWFIALVLMQTASNLLSNNNFERALPLLDEALPIFRTQGRTMVLSVALILQGWVLVNQGRYQEAIALYQEAYETTVAEGNYQGMGWSLRSLGLGNFLARNFDEAKQYLIQCLRIYQQISFKSGIVIALELYAGVVAELGNPTEATQWLAVSEELRQEIGLPHTTSDDRLYYSYIRQLTVDALSPQEWEAAWAAGRKLPLDKGISTILSVA